MKYPHHHERVIRGKVASEHVVQLFDGLESVADSLSDYLTRASLQDDTMLAVVRARHWAATLPKLAAAGCRVEEAIASGRMIVLDAAATLASFTVNGSPDAAKFEAHIGSLIAELSGRSPAGLAIYGEMVDLLAEQGDLRGAVELEQLWNALGQRHSFRLLCGYASANFADERMGRHLHMICSLHDHSGAAEMDLLGSWLLEDRRSRYHADS